MQYLRLLTNNQQKLLDEGRDLTFKNTIQTAVAM